MSLINDALNKVQKERGERLVAQRLRAAGSTQHVERTKASRVPPFMWVMINAGVLIIVLGANHYFTHESSNEEPSAPRPRVTTANRADPIIQPAPYREAAPKPARPVASRLPAQRDDAPAITATSPYVQPAPSSGSESGSTESDYDLAGMTVAGKGTLLSIVRRSDQRSFWIQVGKTVGEVTAVSYNADADNAVIRVRGQLITIGMRNGSVYFSPPPATKR